MSRCLEKYVERLAAEYDGRKAERSTVVWRRGKGRQPVRRWCGSRRRGGHATSCQDPDRPGAFPRIHPDQTEPKNLEQLQAAVMKQHPAPILA